MLLIVTREETTIPIVRDLGTNSPDLSRLRGIVSRFYRQGALSVELWEEPETREEREER